MSPPSTPSWRTRGGSRLSAAAPPLMRRLLNDQRGFEGHGARHVVEVRRGRHDCLVDLRELLLGAAALYADDVAQVFVARRYTRIDAEETSQIDLTMCLDLQ